MNFLYDKIPAATSTYILYELFCREDEDDITAFPVVKETGDKLIETGINTLQRTLLLKKEVEVDRVQAELEAKRYEFKQRMEACAQRQIEIQKKQQRVSTLKCLQYRCHIAVCDKGNRMRKLNREM